MAFLDFLRGNNTNQMTMPNSGASSIPMSENQSPQLKRFGEMNGLEKFAFLLASTKEGFGQQYGKALQDQDKRNEEKRKQSALAELAMKSSLPPELAQIAQLQPEMLPQLIIQQNDPLRRIQMAQAQAGLENAKTERERQSALAQLFGGGGQVQQQMPEGVYGPAPAPKQLSQQEMVMRAAQIDPERYGAAALEAMKPPKSGGLIELSKGASLYDPTTGQFISAPTQAASGAIEPQDAPKFEMDLRKEFDALNKDFRDIEGSYVRIQKAAEMPTAAGDIAMVFNYMKMLDPGSVVREGEFATAQNAAGVPDIVRNMYNRAMQGTRLNAEQRKDFLNTANSIYGGMSKRRDESANYYRGLAQDYGLNPDRIVKQKNEQNTKTNRIKFDAQGNIVK